MIELSAGAWRAALRPEVGGGIAALRLGGVDILRSMPDDADHALQSACFPLVPYCNRIAEGRFAFAGREVSIPANMAGQRHPLHGTGWLRPWRVIRHDDSSALLEDDYTGGGDWPWPYRAHQHFALDARGLTVRLIAENRATDSSPMGLGFHPYFRRSKESVVSFEAQRMLGIDAEILPDGQTHDPHTLAPWGSGAELPPTLVDHCFAGWGGTVSVADSAGAITVRGFGAPHCHVYAPHDGAELCLEPVNHTPDALNRAPWEMTVLPPGAAAGIAMRIEAAPA